MKKIRMFYFVFAFIILASGTFFLVNNYNQKATENIYLNSASQMNTMESIDDLVKYSDLVIIGTVLDSEEINNDEIKYTVSIDKNIKGTLDTNDIDVYEAKNTLQSGKQYILFLGYFDSALYPREVYTSIDKDGILEIYDGKINSRNMYGEKDKSVDSIIKIIEKSRSIKYQNKQIAKIDKEFDSIKNLIESSDYVVRISINEVDNINKYVSDINVNVIQQYKGDIGKRDEFLVPTGLEKGNEYLLFLKGAEDGGINLTSRKGSIISKDNLDNWNKAIDSFSN